MVAPASSQHACSSMPPPGAALDPDDIAGQASLLGEVSHELRNRLTPTLAAVHVLVTYRAHLPPTGQQALDLLAEETASFAQLLTELLDLAREEADGRDPVVETLPVQAVVRAALDRQVGEQRATELLRTAPGAHALLVRADRRRLARVLGNLLTNADTHGGGCVAVHVRPGEAAVLIQVDDAGPGVPHADRDRVLECFARGPHSAGAGLGLALASRWVHRLGGTLSVDDSPAGGARFTLHLPAVHRITAVPMGGHRPIGQEVDRLPPAAALPGRHSAPGVSSTSVPRVPPTSEDMRVRSTTS
ncbi:sensor histidine kinase [Geodermatophilus marinus]|uniref:sensor histidine kinase n=1 Tax=Geodermatophilus sp. LHW52908 TaxID=2303986 RepID=UPI001314313E|nr:HAMP domain-containing sensor histidine kinase [Geodermatophilus sp. LHW52908]